MPSNSETVVDRVPVMSNYSLDPGDVLYLHHSDTPNCALTSEPLNGNNYAQWKRSCEVSLSAKNKLSFVKGECSKPANNSSLLPLWERCNSMVISWLLHSVNKEIASSIIYTPTASQIWKDLSQRFSYSQGTKIYQLQKELSNLSQENHSVSAYFTKCKQLWDEYVVLVSPCSCDSNGSAMNLIERQQLMQFLMGLNDSYQVVRSSILMMNPLPTVNQASSLVLQEEQQREIKNVTNKFEMDSSAFLAHQRQHSLPNRSQTHPSLQNSQGLQHGSSSIGSQQTGHLQLPYNNLGGRKSTVQCNYCRKRGHTIDKCYKLQRLRGQNDRGRRLAASVQHSNSGLPVPKAASVQSTRQHTLTSEQYEQLIALLSKQNMEVTPNLENNQSAFLAGKSFCLLTSQPEMRWIIDSGATDRITPHLSLFKSYTPMIQACFITMPNGKQVQVKHIGIVVLGSALTLQNVLHVPEFQFNLLSASKLAKQLCSSIVFTPTSCYIQDHLKSNLLELGKETGGLYLADSAPTSTKSALQSTLSKQCMTISELWHCRLGHPSSQHMSHIQSLPCKGSISICQVCPQAKQHRNSFPSSSSRTNKIFEMLHVDIWGPYGTPTYDGFKFFLSIVDDYSRATWVFFIITQKQCFFYVGVFHCLC